MAERLAGPAVIVFDEFAGDGSGMGSRRRAPARDIADREPRPRSAQDRPRIILALDCTTSMGEFLPARKITFEVATRIAEPLFAKARSAGLQVKLAFFRGDDRSLKQPRQLQFSNKWFTGPEELARAICIGQVRKAQGGLKLSEVPGAGPGAAPAAPIAQFTSSSAVA